MEDEFDQTTTHLITDINKLLNEAAQKAIELPACVIVMEGAPNRQGEVISLAPGLNTFGRDANVRHRFDLPDISRVHCQIEAELDTCHLTDCGSSNGTFLNGEEVEQKILLQRHDIIQLAGLRLKFLPAADPDRPVHERLYQESSTDLLTGCYNRRHFERMLEDSIQRNTGGQSCLALVLIDLDHFKRINDNWGHEAGDQVLREFGQLMRQQALRELDPLARIGGEEFALILPRIDLSVAVSIAERMHALIRDHAFLYQGECLPVTASLGVAVTGTKIRTAEALYRAADSAVYRSKHNGRNQVTFAS